MLRCIFCGLCVEACPTEAITMTHLFEMSTTNREDGIYTKDELLRPPTARSHMFRTTRSPTSASSTPRRLGAGHAPGGRAAHQGVRMWAGTPGVGDWSPEPSQEERTGGAAMVEAVLSC